MVHYLPAIPIFGLLFATHSAVAHTNHGQPQSWPYNLPLHARYWPEDPPNRRRDLETLESHLSRGKSPIGVLKMSDDPGEKFFLEYWQFDGHQAGKRADEDRDWFDWSQRQNDNHHGQVGNESMSYLSPFAVHAQESEESQVPIKHTEHDEKAASIIPNIFKRQSFACPSGTSSCGALGYENICCPFGETCFNIKDTGLGPVGCCPNGSRCSGSVNTCPRPNTACAAGQDDDFEGGGCCVPGYICQGIGCVLAVSTSQTTNEPAKTDSTSLRTTPSVTLSSTDAASSDTALQSTQSCFDGFHPCPVNLGGGCCRDGRTCGSSSICYAASMTLSNSVSETDSTPSITPTDSAPVATGLPGVRQTADACPGGFYHCLAVHGGNCCRTDRNCDVLSCPPASSTTIVSGQVTIVVPTGSAATVSEVTGQCAGGWTSCPASLGGNCCLSGWQCGTASCTSAGPEATAVRGKASPNSGQRLVFSMSTILVAIGIAGTLLL